MEHQHDAITSYSSGMHTNLPPSQRHVGGRQANVSGWSPRKIHEEHGHERRHVQGPRDAVTGGPGCTGMSSAMHAHLHPERRHCGGRQESVSGEIPPTHQSQIPPFFLLFLSDIVIVTL